STSAHLLAGAAARRGREPFTLSASATEAADTLKTSSDCEINALLVRKRQHGRTTWRTILSSSISNAFLVGANSGSRTFRSRISATSPIRRRALTATRSAATCRGSNECTRSFTFKKAEAFISRSNPIAPRSSAGCECRENRPLRPGGSPRGPRGRSRKTRSSLFATAPESGTPSRARAGSSRARRLFRCGQPFKTLHRLQDAALLLAAYRKRSLPPARSARERRALPAP